ncbi:MAG: hypothetical protein ACK559_12620, partial [bacterium]
DMVSPIHDGLRSSPDYYVLRNWPLPKTIARRVPCYTRNFPLDTLQHRLRPRRSKRATRSTSTPHFMRREMIVPS